MGAITRGGLAARAILIGAARAEVEYVFCLKEVLRVAARFFLNNYSSRATSPSALRREWVARLLYYYARTYCAFGAILYARHPLVALLRLMCLLYMLVRMY